MFPSLREVNGGLLQQVNKH